MAGWGASSPLLKPPAAPIGPWARTGAAAIHAGGHPTPTAGVAPTAAAPSGPWTPAPGSYLPSRDIELSEGKLATEQGLTGDQRQGTNAENTYATNLQLLEQKEAAQKQTGQETLARLAESYKKLAGSQADQGNSTGTLYGGALISAAMKRAHNEGVSKSADERNLSEQLKGDENQKGQLSVAESQLLGPGGSLVEAMQNARQSEQQREEGIGRLKDVEAAEHGEGPPVAPHSNGWVGNVRVGQPPKPQRKGLGL